MGDVMKIVKYLEESGSLISSSSENIEYEAKEQGDGFPSMWLGTLLANLLGTLLAGKETKGWVEEQKQQVENKDQEYTVQKMKFSIKDFFQ